MPDEFENGINPDPDDWQSEMASIEAHERSRDVTDGKCPHCGAVLMIGDTLGPDDSDDSILTVMHCKKIIRVSMPKEIAKLINKVAATMSGLEDLVKQLEGEL